jgi:uncharacterized protein YecT (DUF1311 family)
MMSLANNLEIAFAASLVALMASPVSSEAQTRKPTAKEITAVQECVKEKTGTAQADGCIVTLVAEPCSEAEGGSNLGRADCYRIEQAVWDRILNEAYKELQDELDKAQLGKLRDMQRAWIASRDRTCAFYHDKIQGSMAVPMSAACLLRETAQRALLLKQFQGL